MRSDRRTPEQCQVLLWQHLMRHGSCFTPRKVNGIVSTLTSLMLLQRMLASANPQQWFDEIITRYSDSSSEILGPADQIDRVPWIRLADGTAAALLDLVPVLELAPWIDRVRDGCKAPLWGLHQLTSGDEADLRKARLLENSRKAKLDGLRRLVESVRNEQDMAFGPAFNGRLDLDDIAAAVDGCGENAPSAWRLITCAWRDRSLAEDSDAILNTVIPRLSPSLPVPVVRKALHALEQAWPHSDRSARTALRRVLAWMLAGLDEARRNEALHGLRLPNSRDSWCPTQELCAGWQGIDPVQQVHDELERVWSARIGGAESAQLRSQAASSGSFTTGITYEDAIKQSLAAVELYFAPWQELVPETAIGGFIALLDDHQCVMDCAQRWLGPTAKLAREIRDDLLDLSAIAGSGASLKGRVETILIEVVTADTRTAKAQAVDGSILNVRLMAHGGSPILVPDRQRTMDKTRVLRDADGQPIHVIQTRLHAIDPKNLSRESLLIALREAAEAMLSLLWSIGLRRESWDKICQREQQTMRVLERVMLPKAMVQLEQLRLRSSSAIRAILNDWRIHQHQRASNAKTLTLTEDDILDRLHEALTQEPVEILRAIRDHIGPTHYQYSQTSIPFELVQNADDAISEEVWLRKQAGKADQPLRGITICQDDRLLAIIHHGRQINRSRRGSFDATDMGFDRDLEKMLSISVSDKDSHSGIAVTGRFGLGFKSCYLITDRPEILSGEYDFRIQAGMIPLPIATEDIHLARDIRKDHAADSVNATVIVLPAREGIDLTQVMGRFIELAIWLPLTLRAADAVEILSSGLPAQRWTHRTQYQSPDSRVEVLDLGDGGRQALVLRAPNDPKRCVLVMAFNRQGPAPLPDDVPGLWVTTPLKQADGHGFFVNGPFMVDVGRGQIAIDDHTHDTVVDELRDVLRQALQSLWHLVWHDDDWIDLITKTNMSPELVDDRAGFCSRLLDVLCKPFTHDQGGHPLLRRILWGGPEDQHGVVPVVLRHGGKLPSGLPRPVPELVELEGVTWSVELGLVKILEPETASGWMTACVALDSPAYRAARLMGISLGRLDLARAYGLDGIGTVVRPAVAQSLCASLSRMLADDPRQAAFISALRLKAVKTRAGTEPIIGDSALLLPVDAQYERWLCLASQECVIADGFSEVFCQLLRSAGCRPVSANVLAGWILAAPTDRHDDAMGCLDVAVFDVRQIVELQARGTWLEEKAHEEGSLHPVAMSILQQALFSTAAPGRDLIQQHPVPPEAWQRIRTWWESEGPSALRNWEQMTYPRGTLDLTWDVDDEANRLAWMTLFSIASAQRLGRANAHQHRTFVKLLIQRGWLQRLSEPGQRHQHLGQVIRELVDEYDTAIQGKEYTFWWALIIPIAIFGGSLESYIDGFSELRKHSDPGNVDAWFAPRIQPRLQGVNDAPPIGNLLGIGRHVVIRELVRRGLCQPGPLASYCWVPHARVLRVVGWLTGQTPTDPADHQGTSRWIADRIDKHIAPGWTFDGSFDIPLQFLAQDLELQQRVLGMAIPDDQTEKD